MNPKTRWIPYNLLNVTKKNISQILFWCLLYENMDNHKPSSTGLYFDTWSKFLYIFVLIIDKGRDSHRVSGLN